MSVGLLLVDCFLGNSFSLKEKRRVLSSLTAHLRRYYNIALCEVEYQNQWQRAKLAIVFVNTDWQMVLQNAQKIVAQIEQDGRVSVLNSEMTRLR
ncbi:DUF503 domain-containing protein [candidate division WOR-3 bacterium]|nr:DUF503 domain-containing protein [candidate division WOR-3 bacterium]